MNNEFINCANPKPGDAVTLTVNDPNGVRVYDAIVREPNSPGRNLHMALTLNGGVVSVRVVRRLYFVSCA